MLLNALNQNFVISVDPNFIYPDVASAWKPALDRLWAPYNTCEDFLNSQIASVGFPGIQAPPAEQALHSYRVQKRSGFTTDMLRQKTLTLTIKTTESYISYFMMLHQMNLYLRLKEVVPLYMNPISVVILNDGGFETISYVYKELTMTGISDISLSYAATLGNFNTFTCTFAYNYYDVYMVGPDGRRERVVTEFDQQLDFDKKALDPDAPEYSQKAHPPVSSKTQQKKADERQEKADAAPRPASRPSPVLRSVSRNLSGGVLDPTFRK